MSVAKSTGIVCHISRSSPFVKRERCNLFADVGKQALKWKSIRIWALFACIFALLSSRACENRTKLYIQRDTLSWAHTETIKFETKMEIVFCSVCENVASCKQPNDRACCVWWAYNDKRTIAMIDGKWTAIAFIFVHYMHKWNWIEHNREKIAENRTKPSSTWRHENNFEPNRKTTHFHLLCQIA